MGSYDMFGEDNIQIKAGPCDMSYYAVGDECPLADGIYFAQAGTVVVDGGHVVFAKDTPLFTKWGDPVDAEDDILAPHDYVAQAVTQYTNPE